MVEELTKNSSVQSEAGDGNLARFSCGEFCCPREEPDFAVPGAFLKASGDSLHGTHEPLIEAISLYDTLLCNCILEENVKCCKL